MVCLKALSGVNTHEGSVCPTRLYVLLQELPMSHKNAPRFHVTLAFYAARRLAACRTFILSTQPQCRNTTMGKRKKEIKAEPRSMRLEARVNEQEYARAAELAGICGLTLSDYIRKTALGQHPRRRLTDKEVEALCSLSDARGDLMRISTAVRSIRGSRRAQYFANPQFVEQWMRAAVPLIARWNEITKYITE